MMDGDASGAATEVFKMPQISRCTMGSQTDAEEDGRGNFYFPFSAMPPIMTERERDRGGKGRRREARSQR